MSEPLAPSPPPSLKPRRGLLIVMSIAFTVWVALMLAMYFTTVYPQRHPSHKAATLSAATAR